MSAATLAAPVTAVSSGSYNIPGALQQFLHRIEEQRWNLPASEDLCNLKAALESRWRTASFEGHASSTTLYEILQHGWKEWRRLTA